MNKKPGKLTAKELKALKDIRPERPDVVRLGPIAQLVGKDGRPGHTIYWGQHVARKDLKKKGYSFPPLGPYANLLYSQMFKKWGL